MKSLVRQQFLDQSWDAAHLDAAGRFWLRLYDAAAHKYRYSLTPHSALEIRLSGFARSEGESLRDELERRVAVFGIPNPVVTLRDPDTLVLSTDLAPATPEAPVGLGLPLLVGPMFKGLVAEVRFRITGRTELTLRRWLRGIIDVVFVIVGEVSDEQLLVKSTWRCYQGLCEDAYWPGSDGYEAEWVAAIDEFTKTGTVRKALIRSLHLLDFSDRWHWAKSELLSTPFGAPRLLGLLKRCLVFLAIPGVFAYLCYRLFALREGAWVCVLAPMLLLGVRPWFQWFWEFLAAESRLLFSYRAYCTAYATQYADRISYAILSPVEAAGFGEDPATRKYTADLKAEGFVLIGDVVPTWVTDMKSGYRVFRSPDGTTYLILSCNRTGVWPATIVFQAQTFFQGGGRADSVSGAGFGFRRDPIDHATLIRYLPPGTDPITFYLGHKEAAEAFASEKGLVPLRHERFDDFVRRQEVINAEEREHYARHPYSWWDHLRWYLQLPRREQRG